MEIIHLQELTFFKVNFFFGFFTISSSSSISDFISCKKIFSNNQYFIGFYALTRLFPNINVGRYLIFLNWLFIFYVGMYCIGVFHNILWSMYCIYSLVLLYTCIYPDSTIYCVVWIHSLILLELETTPSRELWDTNTPDVKSIFLTFIKDK